LLSKNRKDKYKMQTANVNTPINITVRHETITDSLRDYVHKKIQNLHLDYPKIIEAKVVLDVQKKNHVAEIILYCANHITIDASTKTIENMYASIDKTVSKIARRMRKHKTRLLKSHRPGPENTIKHLDEKVFAQDLLKNINEEIHSDPEPMIIHREGYKLKRLNKEDALR
jgi:putative sigma-54 modulation protein